jgi:hypothetical protein
MYFYTCRHVNFAGRKRHIIIVENNTFRVCSENYYSLSNIQLRKRTRSMMILLELL